MQPWSLSLPSAEPVHPPASNDQPTPSSVLARTDRAGAPISPALRPAIPDFDGIAIFAPPDGGVGYLFRFGSLLDIYADMLDVYAGYAIYFRGNADGSLTAELDRIERQLGDTPKCTSALGPHLVCATKKGLGDFSADDLTIGRHYKALSSVDVQGMIRILDGSGEDYLYPVRLFVEP